MYFRAFRTHIGLLTLLTGTALLTTSCSTTQPQAEVETFEPVQTTPFVPEESPPVAAEDIRVRADYPQQYIVKKGDTLWDITAKFLHDPWFWPEIWQRNPQVANPHLIYPGDVLTLIYVDGKPHIQVNNFTQRVQQTQPRTETAQPPADSKQPDAVVRWETPQRSEKGLKVVKLSPNIHRKSLDEAIPIIPNDAIRQFITRPRVVTKEVWDDAPYIVGSDDAHLILGAHNKIYIRGELDKERVRYSVFRKGDILRDPETDDVLGYEIIYAGDARIHSFGTPSAGELISTNREILVGDRLMAMDKSSIDRLYYPRLPKQDVNGQVISLFDAISSIAKFQVGVINRGSEHGLEIGHILATYQRGEMAKDKFLSTRKIERGEEHKLMVQLPDERSGLMMIFKTFDKVSYGLILESTRVIRKHDKVRRP